jgi:hypothetical protein
MLRHKISLLTTCIGLFFLIYFLKPSLSKLGVDEWVLYVSNILLLLVSMVNLRLVENGLKNSNPHVFVRSVMGGMTLKMLVLLTAIMVYAGTSPKGVNKYSVLFALIFYVIYLILELSITLKLNKKNHA